MTNIVCVAEDKFYHDVQSVSLFVGHWLRCTDRGDPLTHHRGHIHLVLMEDTVYVHGGKVKRNVISDNETLASIILFGYSTKYNTVN